jgi:hypothetical protein
MFLNIKKKFLCKYLFVAFFLAIILMLNYLQETKMNSEKSFTFTMKTDKILLNNAFNYNLNPGENICGQDKGAQLLLISFNPSATKNFHERMAIRTTWTNKYYNENKNIKNIFIIGLTLNESLNSQIKLESDLYGDIVQGNFLDTYRNLTLKTILGLKWVSEYCANSKFVLKVDDDMVVNIQSLSKYLLNLTMNNSLIKNNSIYGYCKTTVVIRDNSSKFYVPKEEYPGYRYPKYCIGPAYIFTSDLMKPMYNLTKYIKPFVMEDVYVGMLAKELKTTFNNIVRYWSYDPKPNSNNAINFTTVQPV